MVVLGLVIGRKRDDLSVVRGFGRESRCVSALRCWIECPIRVGVQARGMRSCLPSRLSRSQQECCAGRLLRGMSARDRSGLDIGASEFSKHAAPIECTLASIESGLTQGVGIVASIGLAFPGAFYVRACVRECVQGLVAYPAGSFRVQRSGLRWPLSSLGPVALASHLAFDEWIND